jgi:hypothetical protein
VPVAYLTVFGPLTGMAIMSRSGRRVVDAFGAQIWRSV